MTPNLVLHVEHAGESKMVGKVFAWRGAAIFLHEDRRGTQRHRVLLSPGGIDTVVIDWLSRAGVAEVHHYDATRRILYTVALDEFTRTNGLAIVEQSDGRERAYLPTVYWQLRDELPYDVPWINRTLTLTTTLAQQLTLNLGDA